METTTVEFDPTPVLANLEDRTLTIRLVPYGEVGRTSEGPIVITAGDIAVPTDPMALGINLDHKRDKNIGHGASIAEKADGIHVVYAIANTPEGTAALLDAKDPNGQRRAASGEFDVVLGEFDEQLGAYRAVPGKGRLWGGALVPEGAFPSARVLAEIDRTRNYIASQTPEAAPAEETQEGESTVTTTETAGVETLAPEEREETVQIAATIAPSFTAPKAPAVSSMAEPDLRQVFAALADVKNGTQQDATAALQVLAALSDIKYNASGGLTTSGNGVLQHSWVGKLWQGRRYVRKYIDLCNHLFGGIALGGRKGFNIDQGTALVQAWSGNKAAIPSGTASTSTRSSSLRKYGYGADVAREWYDLEGGADVIAAFWEGVADSYALITDVNAMTDIYNTAATTSTALDRLVAPETYPTEYPAALGALIQAIEAVEDADDVPTFAVVNPAAWKQLIYTPKDLIPEFVQFSFSTTGDGTADGRVQVKKAPDSYFTGLDDTEPAVVAGARNAIEFREQGTTPIQIDAVNVANGGLDRAVVGYLETFVVRPASLVLIGTAAA